MPAAAHVAVARAHCQAGRWPQARLALDQALAADPRHATALELLGLLDYRDGRAGPATDCFRRALASAPGEAGLHSLLGVALQAQGRHEEAVACHRRALGLAPGDARALNNLGISLSSLGRYAEALEAFQGAYRAAPADPGVLSNLAAALRLLGRPAQALVPARAAAARAPGLPEAHLNLGNVLRDLGQFADAEGAYRTALRLAPGSALVQTTLADLLAARGRHAEAVDGFRRSLAAAADASVAARLANALLSLNRPGQALAACDLALRHQPADPEALNARGNALVSLGRLDEATDAYARASAARPAWSAPHHNRGLALLNQGRLAEARAAAAQAVRLNPQDAAARGTAAGALYYDPEMTDRELLEAHRAWAECHAAGLPAPAPHANDPDPGRRLRVGYVSPDFRSHAVAFFLEPVLASHDPAAVEVYCYAEVAAPDAVTARLRPHAHAWRDTPGLGDDELAALIRQDGIDVLVDLGGHLAGGRLLTFARRPAPVQVSYLGYPGTTGLEAIHYRLTDAVADPPGEPSWHTEELVRLAGCFCAYAPPQPAPEPGGLPSSLAGCVTFGSLHKLERLNDRVVNLWCRLLHEVPGSRLLLCRHTLRGATAERWRRRFEAGGISSGRLLVEAAEPVGMGHLRAYQRVDVALDTFPWSGHTTACEALWMGAPVLTLRGRRFAGRMVASVLTCLGCEDLIAETTEDYLRQGVALAADEGRREALRACLRGRMLASPLCDGAAFTRGLEQTYRALWRRWCNDRGA
jgi:predicted O-linked N-acetylglucosamine transferase (SPINDLY family)